MSNKRIVAIMIAMLLMVVFTGLVAVIAFELCFMDTTFGGYFPLATLILATPTGFMLGLAVSFFME